MQWFKKHPQWLRRESNALSGDSNYREMHQARSSLFVSHGYILVRLEKLYRYPILIVYKDSTPYDLPLVFPLKRELTRIEVDILATLSLYELSEQISPDIDFYYELRHQNNSGALCILERDNLENGSQFFGITSILQRVRDWYAGHRTGNYPIDSEEIEFVAHFNQRNNSIKLLYPQSFIDSEAIDGDCYSSLFRVAPKIYSEAKSCLIYTGYLIGGFNKSGVIVESRSTLEFPFSDKLNTYSDFDTNQELVNGLVKEEKVIQALWFHIDIEPNPFEIFADLIAIIGNGDFITGAGRFVRHYEKYFIQLQDEYYIGIRFPNRKGILEFQLFKIYKKKDHSDPILFGDELQKMTSILSRYDYVEAIECEKITSESFHQRNGKRADYSILKGNMINVFGVGALGSEIADCLSKAGINLLLYDNQELKAHNAVRHLAGLEYVGEKKVRAIANIIKSHNPFITVVDAPYDLFYLNANYLLDDTISISSVADDNVEGFVNEQLVVSNKSAFYVRALRGGKVARIFRVIPGKDACFNCLTIYRMEKGGFIDIEEDPTYQTLKNECNNPIRPASAADLKIIASMASRLLIDHLQNGESKFNHWIWSTEDIEKTPLLADQTFKDFIPPHPKCSYCNHENPVEVIASETQLIFMQSLVRQNPKIETGGVLAGWLDGKGNINITHASGPGPKAICEATRFEKDVEFCQQFLDEIYVQSNQKIVYVGEWHSHPSRNNRPSGTDLDSLSKIAFGKEYLTDCPAMIIFSNTGEPSCTLHPAGKRYYHNELVIMKKSDD